ncbi:hypothetical protein [Acidicapsa acidisoli]|uniref:hypothetical protein n=1 Tax=Acidicapsa acidisoli TaxID=1615681 RepID=UPI0021DFCB5B|nr:hypothetical protein [Acidicapsa acidisoli]
MIGFPPLEVVLERPLGRHHRHFRTAAAVIWEIREIHRLRPEVILLRGAKGCCEVTLPLMYDLLLERGIGRRCGYAVTVPRRGWVVLVPRRPGCD